MGNYRRNLLPGGTYFFTVNLEDRRQRLLIDNVDLLRTAFREVRKRHPFAIEAIVVLPEHLHTVWTLPEGDDDFAMRWRLIKSTFSRALPLEQPTSASRVLKNERSIWQRRYWEHTLRDENDFERHLDCIHFNPVKHGQVQRPEDWPYSSIHRWIRLRAYSIPRRTDAAESTAGFGER